MFTSLAHAGETHSSLVTEASHTLLNDWYFALPLLFATVGVMAWAMYRLSGSQAAATLTASGCLLLVGIVLYSQSPVVSVVALTVGFCIILLQVISDLSGGLIKPYNKTIKEKHHDVEKKR